MTSIGIYGSLGRMGQAIAAVAPELNAKIAGGADAQDNPATIAAQADVLIDFSAPQALEAHLAAARAVCRDPKLVRAIEHGQVDAARLSAIREAYGRAQEEGLDACRLGKRGDIIVSNGGTPIMVLTSGAGTWAVPQDLGCWSPAAIALHRTLDEVFKASHQR